MAHQIYKLHWRGIDIEAGYDVERETGYRSHFHQAGLIENNYDGDVIAFVTQWLNAEAKSKKWKDYIENSKQLALF